MAGPIEAAEVRRGLTDAWHLIEALGLGNGARPQAGGAWICCPVHDDQHPSCSVTMGPDHTLRWRCFGCGATGDALTLLAAARRLDLERDFQQVLEEGAELAGLAPAGPERAPAPPRRPVPPPAPPPDDGFDQLARVLLELCPVAHQADVARYRGGRGLLAEGRARWGALPAGSAAPGELRAALLERCGAAAWERSGLASPRRSEAFAWPEHRLVIPWRAPGVDGAVLTLQRRLVRPARPGERNKYVFPRGRLPVYPAGVEDAAELLGEGVEVAYVEGAVDTVALGILARRWGRERVVLGLPGVSSWRSAWAELARGAVALVALDPDDAGEAQVPRIAGDLLAAGALRVLRSRPPQGAADWGDLLAQGAA